MSLRGVESGVGNKRFMLWVEYLECCIIPPIIRGLMVCVRDRGWMVEVLGQSDWADQVMKS